MTEKPKRRKYGGVKQSAESGNTARLRALNQLMLDVNIIYHDCGGKSDQKKTYDQLDEFQRIKRELVELLKTVKADIQTERGIISRVGKNTETIKQKSRTLKNVDAARRLHSKLVSIVDRESLRSKKSSAGGSESNQVSEREELVALLKQDLDFVSKDYQGSNVSASAPQSEFSATAGNQGHGFRVARQAREQRRKRLEQQKRSGGNANIQESEVQPLTAKQEAFIQESIERDLEINVKLDVIKKQVGQLNEMAGDINDALDQQDVMLDEIDEKMDKTMEKLESRNKQMKNILEQSGGIVRFGPIICLIFILLALIGYIYTALTED